MGEDAVKPFVPMTREAITKYAGELALALVRANIDKNPVADVIQRNLNVAGSAQVYHDRAVAAEAERDDLRATVEVLNAAGRYLTRHDARSTDPIAEGE